jgi:hypothetical protein
MCNSGRHALNEAARRALEAMMKGYEYQSDFAKKYVALGRDEGRDEGQAEARARDVLTVLRVRGIDVPEAVRERILAQKDLEARSSSARSALKNRPSLAAELLVP